MTEPPRTAEQTWTRQRIEELLRSERFDYQAVPLPHGLSTSGHDRSETARRIFPGQLEGQSVLDVGCSLGYFCFEARRRGAQRVVGLDFDSSNLRKAQILSEILEQPVEFILADLDRGPLGEQFDHVLCLNVLHHLADPILGLDRLIDAAKRRLILEVATFGRHDRRQLGINWLAMNFLSGVPAMMIGRGTAGEGIKQFYFTPSAIENLLRYRRGCFAKVEILRSDFKNRFLVLAHKRRIGRLLAIAGPTASGTDTALQRLLGQDRPAIEPLLGSAGAGPWKARLSADRYHEPQEPEQDRLIFEYDFMRPTTVGGGTFEHDPALEVLTSAERTIILTIWMPPEQLANRLDGAIAAATGRQRKRLARLRGEYADPRRLVEHYRAWFRYTASRSKDHRVIVMNGAEPVLETPEDWDRKIAAPLLSGV
ncbi:MAG TPA: methyltransferase domain-containing protein [Alphaproteobacteria bacterium]|nr:methyltransferase domain-containing protein [Alphaproteobacteria bacterium]